MPITFNNLSKHVFRIRNILLKSKHARTTCKSIFLIEKQNLNGFLKIIGAQNLLTITYCSDLMRNKTLKARNSTPKHMNF